MKITKHRTITGLQGRIQRNVSTACQQWGQVVASNAADHAPIDSGALRRSLTVSPTEISGLGGSLTMTVRVGPDSTVRSYAPRQEFDTSLGFGPKSVAEGATRPWLQPAFQSAKKLGEALVRSAFNRATRGF